MKSVIFLLSLLFALTNFHAQGQSQMSDERSNEKEANLIGIWEFRGTRSQPHGEFRRPPVTMLKVLSGDGTISNLAVTPKGTIATASGSYTIESDSVYVEHIVDAANNKAIDDKDVKLFYKIKDNKQLYLRFFLTTNSLGQSAPATYEELWTRVEVPQ